MWGVLGVAGWSGSCAAGGGFESAISDEVFYHIMPMAWRDSDNDTYRLGDFGGLTASLEYLEDLGITAVWINPIFPSPAYHGYQHGRADQIDGDFGTEQEFIDFVSAANARGIKVYLDFVVYGISHNSPWFQSAVGNPGSQYDSWLAFTNFSNTQYTGYTFNSWNGAFVGFIHWDLRNQAVRDLVASWGKKWLDPNSDGNFDDGVAGYRYDHVWVQYPNGPDGWGYNLDDFWGPFFDELRSVNPAVFNFGEQADWGTLGAEFLSEFDGMFTKPFEFAARDALSSENAGALYSSMEATTASLGVVPDGTYLTIIGDHDVDRLASRIGGTSPLSAGRGHAAAAVLMLQPYAPVIYFGDEIGMLGTKQNYGSDANDIPMREPFKWNAVAGPPMSAYHLLNAQASGNMFSQNNDGRSVEEQEGVAGSLLETYRTLIALRKAESALRRGGYASVGTNRSAVWSFVRRYEPSGGPAETLLVAINLSGTTLGVSADLSGWSLPSGSSGVLDAVTGSSLMGLTGSNIGAYPLNVGGYGYRVLRLLDIEPAEPPVALTTGGDIPARYGEGNLVATQDTPAYVGNNQNELNQMFVERGADGLKIGLTGNLATDGTALVLLIDALDGGQSVIDTSAQSAPPSGLNDLTGMVLDAGFEPETMFFVNAFGSTIYVDQLSLSGSGSVKTYRGRGTVNSGVGTLTGGTNPNGVEFALNNTNVSGVSSTSAVGAADATTGAELWVSYADLDVVLEDCGEIRVAAFITGGNGVVSSQWLPGVGGVSVDLGVSPSLLLVPGEQFAEVLSVAPGCGSACAGDVNGDLVVDLADFNVLAIHFGMSSGATRAEGDLDGDGDVDLGDFNILATSFGANCAG